jgi:hypothetical protein
VNEIQLGELPGTVNDFLVRGPNPDFEGAFKAAHLATGNESSPGLPGSPILVSLHSISDARVVSFLYSAVSVPTLFLPPCVLA